MKRPAALQMKRPAALVMKKPATASVKKPAVKKPAASTKSSVKRPAVATRTPSKTSTARSSMLEEPSHCSSPEGPVTPSPAADIHVDPQEVADQSNAHVQEQCLLMVHVPDFFPGCLPDVPEDHVPSIDAYENAPCGWLREWDFLTQPQRVFLINRPDGIFQAYGTR